MKRRTFSKALLSTVGAGMIGNSLVLANSQQRIAEGNKWSAKGLKSGISHQKPGELHEKHFNYLKQMGVEYLEIRIPREKSSLKNIIEIRKKIKKQNKDENKYFYCHRPYYFLDSICQGKGHS